MTKAQKRDRQGGGEAGTPEGKRSRKNPRGEQPDKTEMSPPQRPRTDTEGTWGWGGGAALTDRWWLAETGLQRYYWRRVQGYSAPSRDGHGYRQTAARLCHAQVHTWGSRMRWVTRPEQGDPAGRQQPVG